MRPLKVCKPSALFLPCHSTRRPQQSKGRDTLQRQLLFPRRCIQRRATLRTRRPLRQRRLQPSQSNAFETTHRLQSYRGPREKGKSSAKATIREPPSHPSRRKQVNQEHLTSIRRTMPTRQGVFFDYLRANRKYALKGLPNQHFQWPSARYQTKEKESSHSRPTNGAQGTSYRSFRSRTKRRENCNLCPKCLQEEECTKHSPKRSRNSPCLYL